MQAQYLLPVAIIVPLAMLTLSIMIIVESTTDSVIEWKDKNHKKKNNNKI